MGDKRVWVVGARETCDIVVDEPTVSGQHCRLELVEGRLYLEDLNSTNGTFVNGERITKRTQIHPDALVTLGKSVTFTMPHQAPQMKSPPRLPRKETASSGFQVPHLLLAAGSAAVILLVIVVLVIVFRSRSAEPSQLQAGTTDEVATTEAQDTPPATSLASSRPALDKAPVQAETETNVAKVPDTEAVYVLAVTDAKNEHRYRVGSAIAVGPHTLVTTATCKTIANLASEKFPNILLLGPKDLTIQQFIPHPEYVEALMEADDAETKFQRVLSRIGTGDVSPEIQQQLDQAYKHFMLIDEKPHHVDLAVIKVKERIGHWLNIAEKPNLAPLVRLTLLGHGFDRVAPYLAPDQTASATQTLARVSSVIGSGRDSQNPRLIRGTLESWEPDVHREMSWNGAGLVNTQGELVGLYSRLMPSKTLGQSPSGETFEASTLADLLPFIQNFSGP